MIQVQTQNADRVHDAILDLAEAPSITEAELLPVGEVPLEEKWEWLLPIPLLRRQYASRVFQIPAAVAAARRIRGLQN